MTLGKSLFRLFTVLVFLNCVENAQEAEAKSNANPAGQSDPIPSPKCDSYSMQTLPSLNFNQRACYWRSQLLTGTGIAGAALWGAVGEWRHKPYEWPQGLDGFGRQMGTRYTQGMAKSTATFLAGLATREDPRPMPPPLLGCPAHPESILGRIGESILRVVRSYHLDKNGQCAGRFAPARIAGSFASGFVALAWLPPSQNNVKTALTGTGTAFGGYIGSSLVSEFQGDAFRLLGKMFTTGKPKPALLSKPAGGGK